MYYIVSRGHVAVRRTCGVALRSDLGRGRGARLSESARRDLRVDLLHYQFLTITLSLRDMMRASALRSLLQMIVSAPTVTTLNC